jgi:hypothetical protein
MFEHSQFETNDDKLVSMLQKNEVDAEKASIFSKYFENSPKKLLRRP